MKLLLLCLATYTVGFLSGFDWPRDDELESTAPVQFRYEVTPDAARLLTLKGVEGCRND